MSPFFLDPSLNVLLWGFWPGGRGVLWIIRIWYQYCPDTDSFPVYSASFSLARHHLNELYWFCISDLSSYLSHKLNCYSSITAHNRTVFLIPVYPWPGRCFWSRLCWCWTNPRTTWIWTLSSGWTTTFRAGRKLSSLFLTTKVRLSDCWFQFREKWVG